MRLVKKHKADVSSETVRHLTDDEVDLLDKPGKEAQELLNSLYGFWIECDCGLPTTIKRIAESNTLFLCSIAGRGNHKNTCHFFRIQQESAGSQYIPAKIGTSFSFSIKSTDGGGAKKSVSETKATKAVGREDKLYSLVAALLSGARTNIFAYSSPLNYSHEQKKVESSSKKFSVGGKSLFQYLFFGFGSLKQAVAKLEETEHLWVGRHKPQALVLAHVESIEEEEHGWNVTVKEGWQKLIPSTVKLTRINGAFNLAKGPILISLIVSDLSRKGTGEYGISRCFAAPVISNNSFMLVDSDLERTFARVAMKLLIENQSSYRLRKPLLPVQFKDNYLLTDFILENDQSKVAIEVMGKWDDDEYRERKNRLLPFMEEYYGSVETVGTETSRSKDAFYQETSTLLLKHITRT